MGSRRLLLLVLPLLSLSSCAKEVGRLSTDATRLELALDPGKAIAFWVELDATHPSGARVPVDIDVLQAGRTVATAHCDALDVSTKLMATRTTETTKTMALGTPTSRTRRISQQYEGEMKCSAQVPSASPTTLIVRRGASAGVDVDRLDIIIKQ